MWTIIRDKRLLIGFIYEVQQSLSDEYPLFMIPMVLMLECWKYFHLFEVALSNTQYAYLVRIGSFKLTRDMKKYYDINVVFKYRILEIFFPFYYNYDTIKRAQNALEQRLGALLSVSEIKLMMINQSDSIIPNLNSIELRSKYVKYYSDILDSVRVSSGFRVIKHYPLKHGPNQHVKRYIVIHAGRLYWKLHQKDHLQASRSMRLRELNCIRIGKGIKPFSKRFIGRKIPENCCFYVGNKRYSYGFSSWTNNAEEVQRFVFFLRVMSQHWKEMEKAHYDKMYPSYLGCQITGCINDKYHRLCKSRLPRK